MLAKPLSKFSTVRIVWRLKLGTKKAQDNLVRYVLTLPFNLIPVVGTAFFIAFNGAGPSISFSRH